MLRHPPKKEQKKNDDDITCYECGKLGHYRTTCPSFTKHHKSKDKDFYKTKGKSSKGRRAYIAWEEEDESSSFNSCSSSDDECANFCLRARKKGETSKVYDFDLDNDYSYSELSKAFNDMYADFIKALRKFEEDTNHLNCALESIKETHTSLMNEHYNVLDTLVEKMEIVECFECISLKLEIEILKGQLTHATSLSCH